MKNTLYLLALATALFSCEKGITTDDMRFVDREYQVSKITYNYNNYDSLFIVDSSDDPAMTAVLERTAYNDLRNLIVSYNGVEDTVQVFFNDGYAINSRKDGLVYNSVYLEEVGFAFMDYTNDNSIIINFK